VLDTLKTPEYSRNMGVNPVNHRVYVVAAKFGPPAAGARRGALVPDSFQLQVIERAVPK